MIKRKVRTVPHLLVKTFFKRHAQALDMTLISNDAGMDRKIEEPAVNRPGLALAGFYDYFAYMRVQIMGNSEKSYIDGLTDEERKSRIKALFSKDIPCLVTSQESAHLDELISYAEEMNICVFQTSLETMKFINKAIYLLQQEFADSMSLHGCMLQHKGMGILIMGKSGAGKSEATIGLLEKGAALVSDDLVRISQANGKITAKSEQHTRGFLEMRGVGIMNVANLYGLAAICPQCNLDLIVVLKPHADLDHLDRIGQERETYNIMGIDIPYVEIPVAPGRDTARMISVTALDLQLRRVGYDMADEFNKRIMKKVGLDIDDLEQHKNPSSNS